MPPGAGKDNFPNKAKPAQGSGSGPKGDSGPGSTVKKSGRRRGGTRDARWNPVVGRQGAVARLRSARPRVCDIGLIVAAPADLDRALWFEPGCDLDARHFLHYNPHTSPGRMGAYCEAHDLTFSVSKDEIERCSHESEYWIRGFLSGNEPPSPLEADGEGLEYLDDPRWDRWREGLERFRETGAWPRWSLTGYQEEFACPVCGFPYLKDPALPPDGNPSFEICPSCGYQFGVTDEQEGIGYATWREQWVAGRMQWQGRDSPPRSWDPAEQLAALRGEPQD